LVGKKYEPIIHLIENSEKVAQRFPHISHVLLCRFHSYVVYQVDLAFHMAHECNASAMSFFTNDCYPFVAKLRSFTDFTASDKGPFE